METQSDSGTKVSPSLACSLQTVPSRIHGRNPSAGSGKGNRAPRADDDARALGVGAEPACRRGGGFEPGKQPVAARRAAENERARGRRPRRHGLPMRSRRHRRAPALTRVPCRGFDDIFLERAAPMHVSRMDGSGRPLGFSLTVWA